MPDCCRCHCHETERGIFNAARHMRNYLKAFTHAGKKREHVAPAVTDLIESLAACELCAALHAKIPGPPKLPWIDLPRVPGDGPE